jgi:tetratricopeptide (TPR) repeat protein
VPARHRSLRAVFDHSWHLLTDEERKVFRRLSVFRGGFTLELAEENATELSNENGKLSNDDDNAQRSMPNHPEGTRFSILDLLAALVDKSLVRQGSEGRYEMHELVLQYATAKLQEAPEEHAAVHDRHCGYYTALLHERADALKGTDGAAIIAALTAESDILRAAWDWAITHRNVAALKQAQFGLWHLYDVHCWHQEGVAMFGRAAEQLAAFEGTTEEPDALGEVVRGQMLGHQGWLDMCSSRFTQARAALEQSIALLSRQDAQAELADPQLYLGAVALYTGQYAEAARLLQESRERYQAIDQQFGNAMCNGFLGLVASAQGHDQDAQQFLQAGVAGLQALGEQYWQAVFLSHLGNVSAALGQYAEAQRLLHESLALSSASGDRFGAGLAMYHLGSLNEELGEYATARRHLQDSLAIFEALGDPRRIATTRYHLGNVTYTLGANHEAWRYFTEALQLAIEAQIPPVALDALSGLAAMLAKAGETGRAIEAIDAVLRQPASGQQTRERAQRLRAKLAPHAPPLVGAGEYLGKSFEAVAVELLGLKEVYADT